MPSAMGKLVSGPCLVVRERSRGHVGVQTLFVDPTRKADISDESARLTRPADQDQGPDLGRLALRAKSK